MKTLAILLTTVSACMVACSANKQGGQSSVPNYRSNRVIPNEILFQGDPAVVRQYMSESGMKVTGYELLDAQTKWHALKFEGAKGLHTVLTDLEGRVEHIEANQLMENQTSLNKYEWPSDKMFFKQYALNNVGQSAPFSIPGERGADMDILAAWKKAQGAGIVVGVIDSGCDYTHPELKNQIKINEKEAPANGGVAGVDDDGNGYVDDVYGYNFVSDDLEQPYYGVPGKPDPMDDNSHGTHVSGAIVAEANNGIGVAGVAPLAKIICVKIGNAQGQISTKDAFRGIRYARSRGVDVMTNSWSGPGAYDSSLLDSEILEVEKAGILFVVAAGNDGKNLDLKKSYPASLKADGRKDGKYKNVLVVGASDNQDNPASFSNYGIESVDVFAPGVNILSTVPNTSGADSGTYGVMSGTSMATPYVTAVSVLIMSYNPSLKGHPEDVIKIIDQTADVKESLVGKAISNGRINANRALDGAVNNNPPINWVQQGYTLSQRGFNQELVDIRHEISVPNAKMLKVHFNFVDIEEPYDSVWIYDKNYRLVTAIESTNTTNYWSPTVPGDTMYVRFVNAKVQRVTTVPIVTETESECTSKGGVNLIRTGAGTFSCDTDSTDSSDSSGNPSKPFYSFNSEGFSIDQVAYVPADQQDAPNQTVTKN